MSSVAIISIGAVTAGSLALTAALLALGAGITASFLLSVMNQLGQQDKENILAEVNNIIYGVRRDIRLIGQDSIDQMSVHLAGLGRIEDEISNAIKKGDRERLSNSLISLSESVLDAKKDLELLKLKQKEVSPEFGAKKEWISHALGSLLADIPEGQLKNTAVNLEKEFKKSTAEGVDTADIDRLIEIEKRLRELVRSHSLTKGVVESAAEEESAGRLKTSRPDKITELRSEIRRIISLIEGLDPDFLRELLPLSSGIEKETYVQRVEMVRNNLKLRYGKLKETMAWTSVYRDVLIKLRLRLVSYEGSDEIISDIDRMVSGKYINKAEYDELLRSATGFIAVVEDAEMRKRLNKDLAVKVRTGLEGLGYSVISADSGLERLENKEMVYLDTRWNDYKVMMRLGEGQELTTRIVRVVRSEADKAQSSEYQRLKDVEVAKQWCKDYDKFLEELGHHGIDFNVKLRREPEAEEVLCIVDEMLCSGGSEPACDKNVFKGLAREY